MTVEPPNNQLNPIKQSPYSGHSRSRRSSNGSCGDLPQQLVSENMRVGTTGSHAVLTVAMDRDVNMFYFTLDKSNWMKLMIEIEYKHSGRGPAQIALKGN
jgi:hypothetical protein